MFSIDLTSRIPIYEQIFNSVVELIITGSLCENDQLPSVRTLAKQTGVNPNTVAKAYTELERTGLIYSVPGRGSFISATDNPAVHEALMSDFDKAALAAAKRGIPSQKLKDRIDVIYNETGKEKP